MVASWAPDARETLTRAELGRRAGRALGDEELHRLAAMGVVAPGPDGYRVDLGLLRLGVRLLDVPLSEEAILAARGVLVDHSRAAARELSRLLRDEVAERDDRDVRSLSAHMQPLVVQALLTTFQRSLREALGEWLGPSPRGTGRRNGTRRARRTPCRAPGRAPGRAPCPVRWRRRTAAPHRAGGRPARAGGEPRGRRPGRAVRREAGPRDGSRGPGSGARRVAEDLPFSAFSTSSAGGVNRSP